jgi:hypothetical protein
MSSPRAPERRHCKAGGRKRRSLHKEILSAKSGGPGQAVRFGDGPIPLAQLERLERLVVAIHRQGLKMRFFSNPQTKALWDLMRDAGVDQAGTDDLARTRAMVPDRFFAAEVEKPR